MPFQQLAGLGREVTLALAFGHGAVEHALRDAVVQVSQSVLGNRQCGDRCARLLRRGSRLPPCASCRSLSRRSSMPRSSTTCAATCPVRSTAWPIGLPRGIEGACPGRATACPKSPSGIVAIRSTPDSVQLAQRIGRPVRRVQVALRHGPGLPAAGLPHVGLHAAQHGADGVHVARGLLHVAVDARELAIEAQAGSTPAALEQRLEGVVLVALRDVALDFGRAALADLHAGARERRVGLPDLLCARRAG